MRDPTVKIPEVWQGWPEMPTPQISGTNGLWIDLSYVLSEDLPRVPSSAPPRFPKRMSIPKDISNSTEIHMMCHQGTHVDAPRHFFADGPAFHEIPLERLYGTGVVWRIEAEPCQLIEPADFEKQRPTVCPGDILLLDTGCGKNGGTDPYEDHAYLSLAAAEWLLRRRIKMVAVDFCSPDAPFEAPVRKQSPTFDFPVHRFLLGHGVLIAEHLTNLRRLAGQRVEAMFMALNIKGSDGGPARVVGRAAAARGGAFPRSQ